MTKASVEWQKQVLNGWMVEWLEQVLFAKYKFYVHKSGYSYNLHTLNKIFQKATLVKLENLLDVQLYNAYDM